MILRSVDILPNLSILARKLGRSGAIDCTAFAAEGDTSSTRTPFMIYPLPLGLHGEAGSSVQAVSGENENNNSADLPTKLG